MKEESDIVKNTEYFRRRERKGYVMMRMVKDIGISIIILSVGLLMLFGHRFKMTYSIVYGIDPLLKNIFGVLCLIYGSFRVYRAVKQDY